VEKNCVFFVKGCVLPKFWTTFGLRLSHFLNYLDYGWVWTEFQKIRCEAKFLTCEISDFRPCTHSESNTLHIKYAEKTDD